MWSIVDRTIEPMRAWVEAAVGQPVDRLERLLGGTSSEVHRCWLRDGSTYVVRHITDRDWLQREPELISQEATALKLLTDSGIPAPEHVASDASAGLLLMTHLPGAVNVEADDVRRGADALGEMAASIAAIELPPDHGLNGWRSWVAADLRAPQDGDRALWSDAIEAFLAHPQPLVETPALVHRDLHPLNILWDGHQIVGVVDWVNACVGHPHADLGHCRWNLTLLAGPESAAAFLRRRGVENYDPWWDICAVMGTLPGPIDTTAWDALGRPGLRVLDAMESVLRGALARF
jgi:aminoglycoside phosphotransferase (APT) family kinase protein